MEVEGKRENIMISAFIAQIGVTDHPLLVRPRHVVEYEEQLIDIHPLVYPLVLQYRCARLGIVGRCFDEVARVVVAGTAGMASEW